MITPNLSREVWSRRAGLEIPWVLQHMTPDLGHLKKQLKRPYSVSKSPSTILLILDFSFAT